MNQQKTPPNGFVLDEYVRSFDFGDHIASKWKRLQLRETFVNGQIFPYRVEFAGPSQKGEFFPGELNIHHGPFLSVHGAIGEINSSYRDLNYFYGSYVLSFRLVRPVRLEFYRDGNTIKLKMSAFVRPWLRPAWRMVNYFLWLGFRYSL